MTTFKKEPGLGALESGPSGRVGPSARGPWLRPAACAQGGQGAWGQRCCAQGPQGAGLPELSRRLPCGAARFGSSWSGPSASGEATPRAPPPSRGPGIGSPQAGVGAGDRPAFGLDPASARVGWRRLALRDTARRRTGGKRGRGDGPGVGAP